ncbi:MAG: hypothetical protein Q4B65_00255 [Candidatus Saccharibacteria bacterium]|nr:hypothetical protein [Candidatus Saccharibacteria bacterium]
MKGFLMFICWVALTALLTFGTVYFFGIERFDLTGGWAIFSLMVVGPIFHELD